MGEQLQKTHKFGDDKPVKQEFETFVAPVKESGEVQEVLDKAKESVKKESEAARKERIRSVVRSCCFGGGGVNNGNIILS